LNLMNKIILLSAIFIACAVGFAIKPNAHQEFAKFMETYEKQYTEEELPIRFANFKASLQRAHQKNIKSTKATYGITKFSDMTPAEFSSTVLMKNKIAPTHEAKSVLPPKKLDAVPTSFDWRPKGAVTPIKNQGQCGSCWAFSATENVESMWILAGKGKNSTVDFAPQQIVDCDTNDDGCDGGDPPTAYEYLISTGGIESNESYPYTAEDGTCKFKKNLVVGTISNWTYATSEGDETTLQQNLLSWGPLSICVDASNWQDYTSGVMTWEECAWINQLDHCVQLVGYNSEQSDNPYWVVRNSWGTDWGVEGYIWLQMWEDTCGLTYEATTSIIN